MSKVIVFGSLNIDITIKCDRFPKKGETVNGYDLIRNFGGKGANQATAAARSNAKTVMIGSVGSDQGASEYIKNLKENNIDVENILRFEDKNTGSAIILVENSDNRIILDKGANHSIKSDKIKEILKKIACKGDIFIVQNECDKDASMCGLELANKMGLYTIYNPAPADIIQEKDCKNISLIVVNEVECEKITNIYPKDDETKKQALEKFKNLGIKEAIITLGKEGSVFIDKNSNIDHIPAFKVEAIDTTAAGDTFIGALSSRIAIGQSLYEAIIYATKASALAVKKYGAQICIPYESEIKNFLK